VKRPKQPGNFADQQQAVPEPLEKREDDKGREVDVADGAAQNTKSNAIVCRVEATMLIVDGF
jgi:hypothetical protein